AAIYDAGGKLFAEYVHGSNRVPKELRGDGLFTSANQLALFYPIVQGEKRYGTLYLATDLSDMYARIYRYAGIALLIFAGTLAAAHLVGRVLHRSISRPLLALAETARSVSVEHDYSVRAQQAEGSELQLLTTAFNQMLGEIQARQAEVESGRESKA